MAIEKDPNTGKIIKSELSSERARELQAIAQENAKARKVDTRIQAVLDVYGVSGEPYVSLLQQWLAGGVGSVAAWKEFKSLVKDDTMEKRKTVRPSVGDVCPVCGGIVLSLAAAQELGEAIGNAVGVSS